jgi:hypothetical protein
VFLNTELTLSMNVLGVTRSGGYSSIKRAGPHVWMLRQGFPPFLEFL